MAEGRGRGAPLKLNDAIAAQIEQALRARNVLEVSGALAGVPKRTLAQWISRGRAVSNALDKGEPRRKFTKNDLQLCDFSHLIARALAEAEVESIALIGRAGVSKSVETRTARKMVGTDEAGAPVYAIETTTIERPPDWRAIAWIAERRWEHWSPRQRQMVTNLVDEVPNAEHDDAARMMSDPAVLAAAEDLAAAMLEKEPDRHLRAV